MSILWFLLLVPVPTQDPIVGSWLGTIDAGVKLRVQFNIAAGGDGYQVTMDSLDQGVTGIPATLSRDGNVYKIEVTAARAAYTGTLEGDGIKGTWSQMGMDRPLDLTRQDQAASLEYRGSLVADQPHGKRLFGDWLGKLPAGGITMRLLLHVRADDDKFKAEMDSLDQGANGLPVDVKLEGDNKVNFVLPSVGGRFQATLSEDGKRLVGMWLQGPLTVDFTMERTEDEVVIKRPQEPKAPFPYKTEEVRFPGGAADVVLAGTLSLPEGSGPHPAVVLISGSGPQNRDEELMGHKPFWVLADHLTRRGIAVLRYDDRGTAASSGFHDSANTVDFAGDAGAAIAFLKQREDINAQKLGLIGHSEGGLIAPMVVKMRGDIAFAVLMAGTAAKGSEILLEQSTYMSRASGASEADIAFSESMSKKIYEILGAEKDNEAAASKIRTFVTQATSEAGQELPEAAALDAQIRGYLSPWFRFFLHHDPLPDLKALSIPVLALFGEKDMQVTPALHEQPMRDALANNKQASVRVLPGHNHLFQTCQTGHPAEYAQIEETLSATALESITQWIKGVVGQ